MFVNVIHFPAVKAGKDAEFREWFAWSNEQYAKHKGFIRRRLMLPRGGSNYAALVEHESYQTFMAMHTSATQAEAKKRVTPLLDGDPTPRFYEVVRASYTRKPWVVSGTRCSAATCDAIESVAIVAENKPRRSPESLALPCALARGVAGRKPCTAAPRLGRGRPHPGTHSRRPRRRGVASATSDPAVTSAWKSAAGFQRQPQRSTSSAHPRNRVAVGLSTPAEPDLQGFTSTCAVSARRRARPPTTRSRPCDPARSWFA